MSGVHDLVCAIVEGTHELIDADPACRGRGELFEPQPYELADDQEARHTAALRLCSTCPALGQCRRWLASEPRSRWDGWVVAGQLVGTTQPRPRPAKSGPAKPRREQHARTVTCDCCGERFETTSNAARFCRATCRRRAARAKARGVAPTPPVTVTPAACGTRAGYERHRRAGETPCEPCKRALGEYAREYRRRSKAQNRAEPQPDTHTPVSTLSLQLSASNTPRSNGAP